MEETSLINLTSPIPAKYIDREKFFLNENNEVNPLIEGIRNYYLSIAIDGSTDEGRKQLKKLAAELNKVKNTIDGYGKEVVDVLKAKPKKIDAGRKTIKDALDDAYNIILKPVREYEAEQARIKAEAQAKLEEQQRKEREELERLRAEKAQQEREARIAEEAASRARIEAENKIREAELALQSERSANERNELAKLAAEQKKAAEDAKRVADINHQREIKNGIYRAFTSFGIEKQSAIDVIDLIDSGKIPNLKIIY